MGKHRNGKAAGMVIQEMIKDKANRVVNWIWRLCNMAVERDVIPEDWRYAAKLEVCCDCSTVQG